jgi:hypothetical protein
MIDPLQFLAFYTIMVAGLLMFYYFVRHARKRAVAETSTQIFGIARRIGKSLEYGREPRRDFGEVDAVRIGLLSDEDRRFLVDILELTIKRFQPTVETKMVNRWLEMVQSAREAK